MDEQAAELVRALAGVNNHVPRVSRELLTGTMPPERERAFAALLMELADVLVTHANAQEEPTAPVTLADRVGVTGRRLVAVSARLRTDTATGDQLHEVARVLEALAGGLDLYAGKLPSRRSPRTRLTRPSPPARDRRGAGVLVVLAVPRGVGGRATRERRAAPTVPPPNRALARQASEAASSTSVRAAKPVAPGTTSS
ncbi:hypothetical protein [Amycolatopsis sp. lyj-346]|uniref:hypothetical protein n=1 Tax=Amycolatopsis sp. lyj-346 TaxID=2789289 RepID=UPI00397C2153